MARRNRWRSLLVRRLLRSLRQKLHRWLVGMAERCCRARRCGLVSLVVVERRAVSRRRARAVGIVIVAIVAESAVDVGGIAGADAMSSGVAGASVRKRRGPMWRRRSIVQSRAGLIRRRLCCRR